MAAITDGTFTSPVQDGDKQVSFPYDFLGDAYARMVARPYVMLSSSYTQPRTLTTASVTNYLLRSESFGNASWTKTNVTATDNGYYNPMSGALTANVNYETAVNAEHSIAQAYTATAASHVISLYARADGRDYIRLKFTDSAAASYTCFFNLASGTVGTASGATGTILSVGNSWYRCSAVFTPAAGAGTAYYNFSTDGSTVSYLGDTNKGVLTWGAQMERASSVGMYLPTTSATRTSALVTTDYSDNGTADAGADPFAFLTAETPPDAGSLNGGIARFGRTYARVPADQVSYPGSLYVALPAVPDSLVTALPYYYLNSTTMKLISGGNGATYTTAAGVKYVWSPTNKFWGAMTQTQGLLTVATGGTFTLTYKTSTTGALAYNASGATIDAALNALADVVTDGITFTASSNQLSTAASGVLQLNISAGSMKAPVTATSSLTPTAASSVSSVVTTDGTVCSISIMPRATVTSHGYSAAALLIQSDGAYYEADTSHWVNVDANTIAYDRSQLGTSTYRSVWVGQYERAYTPATRLIGTRKTESFYYPGWSSGITTGADIPRVAGLQTDTALIDAVLTQTGFQTYRSEGPEIWQGRILKLTTTAINLDDIT